MASLSDFGFSGPFSFSPITEVEFRVHLQKRPGFRGQSLSQAGARVPNEEDGGNDLSAHAAGEERRRRGREAESSDSLAELENNSDSSKDQNHQRACSSIIVRHYLHSPPACLQVKREQHALRD